MRYEIRGTGESRSFPAGDPFLAGASVAAPVLVLLGAAYAPDPSRTAVLIELGTDCLGVHTGEDAGREGGNAVGFARYRNGADAPSPLVELVGQPATDPAAVAAARAVFEEAGLEVALSADRAGRIVDRLARPKYNHALRLLDERLATAADLDLTCRLGLGYPDGPIERVTRGGLVHHHDVCRAIHDLEGIPGAAPARRAVVAKARAKAREGRR